MTKPNRKNNNGNHTLKKDVQRIITEKQPDDHLEYNQLDYELQVHLAEYTALKQEHDRIIEGRQQLLIAVLAATATIVAGAFATQIFAMQLDTLTPQQNLLVQRLLLILSFGFTFLTWWYIRSNYSVMLLDLYILSKLTPKLSQATNNKVLEWTNFQWRNESSRIGRFVVVLQTISKFGIAQGPSILCLWFWGNQINWQFFSLQIFDLLLFTLNLIGFIISIVFMYVSLGLARQISREIKRQ